MTRKRLTAAVGMVGLGVAAWWGLSSDGPSVAPVAVAVVAPVVPSEPVQVEAPVPVPVVPVAMPQPLAAAVAVDAGQELEVTLEVFEGGGHLAAEALELRTPPFDPKAKDPFPAEHVHVVTNLMGFARLALRTGVWEVDNFPTRLVTFEVTPEHTHFVIDRVSPDPLHTVRGVVVDADDQPVAGAEVISGEWGANYDRMRSRWNDPEHLRETTNARGEFVLTTGSTFLWVKAEKESLVSAQVIATSDGAPVRLMLFSPSWVEFRTDECRDLFMQYELNGRPHEFFAVEGAEVALPKGELTLRARCIGGGGLFQAITYKQLTAGKHARVWLYMERRPGIRIRLTDATGATVPGATVHLQGPRLHQARTLDGGVETGKMIASAVTDRRGRAELTPWRLCSYAPVYDLVVDPALRLESTPLVQLGDDVLEVRVFLH